MNPSTGGLAVLAFAATIGFQFLLSVLAADFVSGLLHWLEDAYGREDFPITGRLFTQPNILHHHNPRSFTKNSWLQSSWDLICLSLLLVFCAWLVGLLTWHVWVVAILGANANQVHKWAHRTPAENGMLITCLQGFRIIQSPRHHACHHTDPKNSHYCVLTDFLNPLLDGLGFWQGIERVVARLFGLTRRPDTSLALAGANLEGGMPSSSIADRYPGGPTPATTKFR